MKNLILTAALFLTNAALACPGSHLYTLNFKGKPAFEIDMTTAKISRVQSNDSVALIRLTVNGNEICREVNHSKSKCSDLLPTHTIFGTLKSNPIFNTKANVEVTLADAKSVKVVTITQFPGLARGSGCGPTVEAK